MTKEEAIRILSTRDSYGMVTGYAGGIKEAIDMGLEALKRIEYDADGNPYMLTISNGKELSTCSVLDKIKAEIETDLSHFCFDDWGNENPTWKEVKAIIDKYKGAEK